MMPVHDYAPRRYDDDGGGGVLVRVRSSSRTIVDTDIDQVKVAA